MPVCSAKLASLSKPLGSGGPADQDRGGQRTTPELLEQLRALRLDQREQLALERIRLTGQAADLRDLLARDPHTGPRGQSAQPPVDAVEHLRLVQRALLERGLELGAQRQQMPSQPVLDSGALDHEIVAVISQQPDLHRPLVQIRDRELLDAVLDDRSGDRERVDLVRLARLALPLPRRAHPVRCHANDPLTGGDQRLLQAPGDVPAVLDRPHPLVIQPPRPLHRREMPRIISIDLPAAANAAGSLIHRRQRVLVLVRVHPDHNHSDRPFGLDMADEADLRRTALTRGGCHAPIKSRRKVLGRRRATQPLQVRPAGRQAVSESARRQPENQPQRSDVTVQTNEDSDSESSLSTAIMTALRGIGRAAAVLLRVGHEQVARGELRLPMRGEQGSPSRGAPQDSFLRRQRDSRTDRAGRSAPTAS